MKLTFRLALKVVSVTLVLCVGLLVHHLAQAQQSGTEAAQKQQPAGTKAQGFCASTKVQNGEACEFAGATISYDDNDNPLAVDCFYVCPSDDRSVQLQIVESKNQQLTTFDNLPLEEQKAHLWNKGPFVPENFNRNDMSLRAFIRAGWSLYVSYSLKENTAKFKLTSKYIGPFSQELHAGDKVQEIFKVPDLFGPELTVANITLNAPLDSGFQLHAIGILEEGRPSKNHASSSALPLEVREPISEVTITPKKISAQREEKISYSFFSRSPYTSATAEFFSFKPNAKGEIVPTRVYTDKFKSIKANKKTDARQWDGKNWKGQFSFGEHQLQIRAWRGPGSSGEWFGPYYGPRVRVLK